jgi:hypothetical protein
LVGVMDVLTDGDGDDDGSDDDDDDNNDGDGDDEVFIFVEGGKGGFGLRPCRLLPSSLPPTDGGEGKQRGHGVYELITFPC